MLAQGHLHRGYRAMGAAYQACGGLDPVLLSEPFEWRDEAQCPDPTKKIQTPNDTDMFPVHRTQTGGRRRSTDVDVKPPPFRYVAARDLEHALAVLTQAGGDAKILAGGQSLVPMLNFRLVNPTILLDINRIVGLDRIVEHPDHLSVGALVRHRMTSTDPSIMARFPVLTHAMTHVAHHTIRNRGTFVGSLCHADPAAEMPMLALLLNAEIEIASTRGVRRLQACDFFLGPLTTALEADELVTSVDIPFSDSATGWGFEEFARRHGDYALAAVAVTLSRRDGRARDVRIAVMGVGDTASRMPAAETELEGNDLDGLPSVIGALRGEVEPNTDLHASADYRRHLVGVLAGRAIAAAWDRAL